MSVNSFFDEGELKKIGFKSLGKNVLISKKASIYGQEKITIGNNVRIDDYCLLSGKINLHNNIHISAYSALYGGDAGIEMMDYSGLSGKCSVYALSDDFSGKYLVNSTVDIKYRNVIEKSVLIEKYVQIGAGSTVLPGVVIKEGTCVGSMSLVNKSLDAWKIYIGVPCRILKERERTMLNFVDMIDG